MRERAKAERQREIEKEEALLRLELRALHNLTNPNAVIYGPTELSIIKDLQIPYQLLQQRFPFSQKSPMGGADTRILFYDIIKTKSKTSNQMLADITANRGRTTVRCEVVTDITEMRPLGVSIDTFGLDRTRQISRVLMFSFEVTSDLKKAYADLCTTCALDNIGYVHEIKKGKSEGTFSVRVGSEWYLFSPWTQWAESSGQSVFAYIHYEKRSPLVKTRQRRDNPLASGLSHQLQPGLA